MKSPLITAGAAVLLCAITLILPAEAIPNQVGVGFINPAGMRLEDFAAQESTWESGAKLPGDWEMWNDESVTDSGIELLRLKLSAIVFGVQAKEVIVHRRNVQIEKIEVIFAPDKKSGDLSKLEKVLRKNAATWSDAKATSDTVKGGSAQFAIATDANENQSVITVTRLKAVAAAAAATP